MDANESDIEAAAKRVLRYLEQHPNAADTVEGVAVWWLGGNESDEWLSIVRCAIERLVNSGDVSQKTMPDGTTIVTRSSKASNAKH